MAQNEEQLSGAMQENLLTLLCFDDAHCKLVRAGLTPHLFESSVFREIAGIAIDFIDQYGEAVKDHLPDHLEGVLNGDDHRKASSYKRLLNNLFQARDAVNADYVVSQLHAFVRQQTIKSGLIKAVEAIDSGRVDLAELELTNALKAQVVSFEPGLNFSDATKLTGLLDELEEPGVNIGIKELDHLGIIPRRKELMLFIAPRGRGKSWFCIHAAKMAILQRWTVVLITLEMSEKRYAARFLQSFFSISKRESHVRVAQLITDRSGRLTDVMHEQIERKTLDDPDITGYLASKIKREFRKRPPLFIKQFPTKGATIDMIEAYLEGLERFEGTTPDMIIVDYPDLMKHDAKNKRIELGELVEQLRGLGVKRNAAVVVPSQGNRESEKARTVTGDMVAEDISKNATADVVLTYSQTPMEKKLGLARLFVDKARNEADKFGVLITQAYGMGQFSLDSAMLDADYWDLVDAPVRRPNNGNDDEDHD